MKKYEQNYSGLLPSGITFIILGFIFNGTFRTVFLLMGIVFLIAYFANKDKLPKDKKHKR